MILSSQSVIICHLKTSKSLQTEFAAVTQLEEKHARYKAIEEKNFLTLYSRTVKHDPVFCIFDLFSEHEAHDSSEHFLPLIVLVMFTIHYLKNQPGK